MASNPKDDQNKEDSSTKYILEYYRKYSQNRELHKYFSGTSITYLPEIVDDKDLNIKSAVEITTGDPVKKGVMEELELSPTGSVASNKILDWDNLADIGYDNVKTIHRTSSLPIFPIQSNKKNASNSKNTISITSNAVVFVNPSSSSSAEKTSKLDIEYSSSSSVSSTEKSNPPITTTSPSQTPKDKLNIYESSSNEDDIIGFKQTLDYLKTKIGLPHAQSTPSEDKLKICNTPVLKKSENTSRIKKSKKPINVDPQVKTKNIEIQTSSAKSTNASDIKEKIINLCLTKPLLLNCVSSGSTQLTTGVQTNDISNFKINDHSRQIINFYKHSDSEKANSDTKSTSSNIVVSNCDSFEFKKPNEELHLTLKNQEETRKTEAIEEVKSVETLPKNVSNELEKTIYVLQKLLRSKKYDLLTKKRYIKKILQHCIDSTCLEDSSTSSELFYPKPDPSRNFKEQIKFNQESSSSYQSHEDQNLLINKKKTEFIKTLAKDNLGSKPSSSSSSPKKKKAALLTTENLINYIPKDELSNSVTNQKSDIKKGPFTLTTKTFEPLSCKEGKDSSSTTQSYENWKKSQTNSELIFENNKKTIIGDGDHLVINFADKERQYQLNWIDREINHLGKLKYLLEKPRNQFEEEGNIKKTTSVYMVTGSERGKDIPKRNYVIETKLGVKGSQQRNFRLNGENYVVLDSQNQEKSGNKKPRQVVADIDVQSDSRTTNIKVTTFCSACKKTPCICKSILDESYPTKLHKKIENSTSSGTSSRYSEKTLDQDLCVICNNGPCRCVCDEQGSKNLGLQTKSHSIPVKGYVTCPSIDEKDSELCLCDLASGEDASSSSKETQLGSLGKIFINCKCDTECECNCEFVNKLLKHFSKQEINKPKTNVRHCAAQVVLCGTDCSTQVDNRESDYISTQVAVLTKDSDSQDSKTHFESPKSQNINSVNIIIDEKETDVEKSNFAEQSTSCSAPVSKSSARKTNVATDPLKNINLNIQIDQSKPVTEKMKHTPEDLYQLISKIEQALLEKNIMQKPNSLTRTGDKSKAANKHLTVCSPEGVSVVQCGTDMPLSVDSQFTSNNKSPNENTVCASEGVTMVPCTSAEQETSCSPCDKSTTYSPPMVPVTIERGVPAVVTVDQCTSCDDDERLGHHRYSSYQRYASEKLLLDQQTSYNAPEGPILVDKSIQPDKCICDDNEGVTAKNVRDKNGKGTVNLEIPKDVKSIDVSFCLCGQKNVEKRSEKSRKHSEKKKTHHRKSCLCRLSSKSTNSNSALGESNNDKPSYCPHCQKKPDESSTSKGDTASDTLSTNTTSSGSTSLLVCSFCHKTASHDRMSMLWTNDKAFTLCSECLEKKAILTPGYLGQESEDTYTLASSNQSHNSTDGFGEEERYCTCPKDPRTKNKKNQYCVHCRNQLKRTLKSGNGIAYTLTLEEDDLARNSMRKMKKNAKLQEIKVKVPCPYNRKKDKNEENINKKEENRIKQIEDYGANGENCVSDNNSNRTEINLQQDKNCTLQEYLKKNRPEFINTAEYRRQTVLNNKIVREQCKDDKKLRFLEENQYNYKGKGSKLFSEQEMKEITRRNYKKLPEVQQKASIARIQRLRSADKFITNMFQKKIQKSILKGKGSFPIDKNIVNYCN